MTRCAVAFCWTLPLPRHGFFALPAGVDAAAKVSRTIRYQQAVIGNYAKAEGYTLIHEEAFMEQAPDRGTDLILGPLTKLEQLCRKQDGVLLYVDFWSHHGWRSHGVLRDWLSQTGIRTEQVPPEPCLIDGTLFRPEDHFTFWRADQQAWTADKAARAAACYREACTLRADGLSYAAVARHLNDTGQLNLTGKSWTADNLRKFVTRMKSEK